MGKRRSSLLRIAGALPAPHIFPNMTADLPIEQRQCSIDGDRRAGPRDIDHAVNVSQQGSGDQLGHLIRIEEIGVGRQRQAMDTLSESRQRRNPGERAPAFSPRRGENAPIVIFRLPAARSGGYAHLPCPQPPLPVR